MSPPEKIDQQFAKDFSKNTYLERRSKLRKKVINTLQRIRGNTTSEKQTSSNSDPQKLELADKKNEEVHFIKGIAEKWKIYPENKWTTEQELTDFFTEMKYVLETEIYPIVSQERFAIYSDPESFSNTFFDFYLDLFSQISESDIYTSIEEAKVMYIDLLKQGSSVHLYDPHVTKSLGNSGNAFFNYLKMRLQNDQIDVNVVTDNEVQNLTDPESVILVIDDAAYSATNLVKLIDELRKKNSQVFIEVCLAGATEFAAKEIANKNNANVTAVRKIESLADLINYENLPFYAVLRAITLANKEGEERSYEEIYRDTLKAENLPKNLTMCTTAWKCPDSFSTDLSLLSFSYEGRRYRLFSHREVKAEYFSTVSQQN